MIAPEDHIADFCKSPAWFTSSYSNGAGGECVEAAVVPGHVFVRDSTRPAAAQITFRGGAWSGFVQALQGEGLG